MFFKNSFDLIFIIDNNGFIKYCSSSITKITGYKINEIKGKTLYDFIHEEDRNNVKHVIDNLTKMSEVNVIPQYRIKSKLLPPNQWIYLESIATNLMNNKFINGILINSNDISSRKWISSLLTKTMEDLNEKNLQLTNSSKRMADELTKAQKIQQKLLPNTKFSNNNYNYSVIFIPANELGGDFYDIYKKTDNEIFLSIADVSGHGAPSALISALLKTVFLNSYQNSNNAGELLTNVNKVLYNLLVDLDYYITAACCFIDLENMILNYSSAGHPEIILFKKDKTYKLLPKMKKNLILTFDFNVNYFNHTEKLDYGDKIILYTDGLVELTNINNELFSKEKLIDLIIKDYNLDSVSLTEYISMEIDLYSNKRNDDISLIIIEITKK